MDQITDKTLAGTDFSAEAFLARLGERGVEYVFANAGTDFAPIIEAVSRNSGGRKYPRFITAPHENLAMAMANGYYRVAGKPAAGLLHVPGRPGQQNFPPVKNGRGFRPGTLWGR